MDSQNFDTIIVGAGIGGSAVAAYLSESDPACKILVIDRSVDDILGSTGYAPGLVGQLNVSPVLTTLAQDAVREYKKLESGAFRTVSCVELVANKEGKAQQAERMELAKGYGISAEVLNHDQALDFLPPFVREDSFTQALYFPDDGISDPQLIIKMYRAQASSRGVQFVEGDVAKIAHDGVKAQGIETRNGERYTAARIILATGIWTANMVSSDLQQHLPIIPVAHPYVYSSERPTHLTAKPFIRWPSHHVYARAYDNRDGVGSYNHVPIAVSAPGATASYQATQSQIQYQMDQAISSALQNCILQEKFPIAERTTSMFAVTPDNLPLVGPLNIEGLWVAAAIWVTTAAGCAKYLVRELMGGQSDDDDIRRALDPRRFESGSSETLEKESLRKYNDIYDAGEKT